MKEQIDQGKGTNPLAGAVTTLVLGALLCVLGVPDVVSGESGFTEVGTDQTDPVEKADPYAELVSQVKEKHVYGMNMDHEVIYHRRIPSLVELPKPQEYKWEPLPVAKEQFEEDGEES